MITEIFTNEDGTFIIFPNDAIAQHIKKGQRWEDHFSKVVREFVKPGDTVLDCGANFGYNSVVLGKRLDNQGLLVAFEPQRIIYQQLNGNLILNNIFNAITYNAAIGAVNSTVTMRHVDYNQPWVNIGDTSVGEGGEEVAVIKLDDLELEAANFMKVDVQGYELFLLQGAETVLKTYQPDLFIEIEPHQLEKFNTAPDQIITYLKDLGYSIYRINNEYPCDHICTIKNLDKVEALKQALPLIEV
jgi:FkbM family methyltransferase